MIPRLHKRGKSFKGTLAYVLHDAGSHSADRVAWTLTQNLVSPPETAWFEMLETYKAQDALKARAGVDARGRKNTSPVLHYSLSWAPDEAPTPEHMQKTALSSLKALGLSEHEAVIAGHTDKGHLHVHIVVNTVHPSTGRTAALKFAKLEMSRWAEAYEKEHGIHCDARLQNNEDRRIVAGQRRAETEGHLASALRGEFKTRAAYVPIKDSSPHRGQWEAERSTTRLSPDHVLDTLTKHHSTFTRADLAREINGRTRNRNEFDRLLAEVEASSELTRLADAKTDRYTTQSLLRTERDLARMATEMGREHSHHTARLEHAARKGPVLSAEQETALSGLIGPEQLTTLLGYAGTGKSTLLGAARQSWERSGYRVLGTALSGIAAEGLQSGSGIESRTIYRLLLQIENGKEALKPNDVLVVDEAGMVGSRQIHKLLKLAEEARAKVVLVGDPEQLQAIEAGAAFRMIAERSQTSRLTTVRRQTLAWQREATIDLAEARTARALKAYAEAGQVRAHGSDKAALDAVARSWAQDQYVWHPADSTIMMTGTNRSAAHLNDAARSTLKSSGHLGKEKIVKALDEGLNRPRREFELPVAIGDRLLFTKNDPKLEVRNGTLGQVEGFGASHLIMRIGGAKGRLVDVDLTQYRNFAHGYAVTVHKAQGVTVDRAHVLAEPNMDRHSAYVALSRHRKGVELHWSQETFRTRDNMTARLSRERLKDTSIDYPEAVMRLANERSMPDRPLERSLARTFAREGAPARASAAEIRAQARAYRDTRARGADFGRER